MWLCCCCCVWRDWGLGVGCMFWNSGRNNRRGMLDWLVFASGGQGFGPGIQLKLLYVI